MDLVSLKSLTDSMIHERYLKPDEIFYSRAGNGLFVPRDLKAIYVSLKDNAGEKNLLICPDLTSFNGPELSFIYCNELLCDIDISLAELQKIYYQTNLISVPKMLSDIWKSRVYSEIEGTLSVEAIQTTRKRVEELSEGRKKPEFKNDFIIRNMINGMNFVLAKPEFNKGNLFKLYSLLSEGCLEEDCKLRPGEFYRYDGVEIGKYHGCPVNKIEECMNSLFDYVDKTLKGEDIKLKMLLPHIAHYYLVYIHPYFDYNGRTARMVSFWLNLLADLPTLPFISEAIDDTKGKYYQALETTRDCFNDLTYFLIYIYETTIQFSLVYQNLEIIEQDLKNQDVVLSETEKAYLKKILVHERGKFTYKDFNLWIKSDLSKQGSLKILNTFVEYDLLDATITKSKAKLFSVNSEKLKYRTRL